MSRKSWFILTVVAVFMFSVSILANNAYAVDSMKGKVSLGGQISFQSTEVEVAGTTSDTDTTAVMGSLGYFITDHIEVNFTPIVMTTETKSSGTTTKSTLSSYFFNTKYNFYKKGWTAIPYIGIQAGITYYEYGSYNESAFSYGGMGGVKFFITENVSANLEYNYMKTSFDVYGYDVDVDTNAVFLGFSYYFGG